MTRICEIKLENVRAFSNAELRPGPGLNLVGGSNGAGKTSFLEAIYLAGRGRTFRHPDAGPLIFHGASHAQVVLTLDAGEGAGSGVLGIRRGRSEFECRFNGAPVHRRSMLADLLPLLFISSTPQTLVVSGPDTRRRFLDMAMFHVEPGYLSRYSLWLRTLRQRNAALAAGDPQLLASWDHEFSEASSGIDESRQALLGEIAARTDCVLRDEFGFETDLHFEYRKGWSREKTLVTALRDNRGMDLERGFTSVGPQRADLLLSSGGYSVDKRLSRGQLKMLVIALNLAVVDLIAQRRGRERLPLVLIDDLGSELDPENQNRVLCSLRGRGVQGFVALIDPASLPGPETVDEVFHVEQGTVRTRKRV